MDIFQSRESIKPYEYPHLIKYADAINNSYWLVSEYNFTNDIQDFKINCNSHEKTVIKRTMLSIAQIEVKVKRFWANISNHLQKPEIDIVGSTFADSEVRHMRAYSELLTLLNLDKEFENLENIPEIQDRMKYLTKYLDGSRSENNKVYTKALMLFSLFIEHVSLFSQFLIMQSFNKHRNILSGFSNVVDATMQEENIHGLFGIEIVNIIRKEHPEFFDDTTKKMMESACIKAYAAEAKIVDWIMDNKNLSFLSVEEIKEFIKDRFNKSLIACGFEAIFDINEELLKNSEFIDIQLASSKEDDFFYKKSVSYNKFSKPVSPSELF